jgi:hypothetical protein
LQPILKRKSDMIFRWLALAALVFIFATPTASAREGVKCKLLGSVEACVKCSMQKSSSARFTASGISDWCAKQVALNSGTRKK